uniref:Transposase n=1 Tax=Heterorhabditis bacteriophora TaxID=37862 RepID=A0A1I7X5P7_HETBA
MICADSAATFEKVGLMSNQPIFDADIEIRHLRKNVRQHRVILDQQYDLDADVFGYS